MDENGRLGLAKCLLDERTFELCIQDRFGVAVSQISGLGLIKN